MAAWGEENVVGPTAPVMRLRKPRWKDPRLIVGIVLVVASVLMGALLVSRLSATTPVLVARSAIVPGQTIEASDFVVAEVRLGDHTERYAGSVEAVPDGAVAMQAVQEGEVVLDVIHRIDPSQRTDGGCLHRVEVRIFGWESSVRTIHICSRLS